MPSADIVSPQDGDQVSVIGNTAPVTVNYDFAVPSMLQCCIGGICDTPVQLNGQGQHIASVTVVASGVYTVTARVAGNVVDSRTNVTYTVFGTGQ